MSFSGPTFVIAIIAISTFGWIQVVVTDAAGKVTEWSLEGGSPGILSRNGWKRNSLTPGEKVTLEIYPLRSGEPGGSFIEVTKADGSKLFYHG